MRLIDGDKLIDYIKHTNLEFMQNSSIIKHLEDIIDKQSEIIIKKEITHTSFYDFKETKESFYQCDKCGCLNILSDANYCPGCGRKIES